MKYRELLNNITEVAKKHPNINSTFIGDVFELNHRNDVDYCAFVITNGTHRVNSDEDYIDYTLNLFYVDRLTADESNRTQIHSSGIDFMNSLLRAVEKLGVTVVEHTENVFNERFNDVCAGVYATVVLRVDIDECGNTIEIITPDELKTIRIDHNGIYDGLFKQVDVNVQGGGKEPVLETLNVKDNGTYRPNTGIDGFDIVEVNIPKEIHNVTSKSITANGTYNSTGDEVWNSVDVNVPERVPVLESLSVNANGTYNAPSNIDGYNTVSVNVPKERHNVTSKSITANGTYNSDGDDVWNSVDVNVPERVPVLDTLNVTDNGTYTPEIGVDGYDRVTVNVLKEHHNVVSKSITANGVYNSTGDEVWNRVDVNVPEKTFNTKSITKTYTENGQYSIATPDGYDGISDVSVNVNVPERQPVLDTLNITENGTYTPSAGVDGYNSVTVNVSTKEPVLESLSVTKNGTYRPNTGVDGYKRVDVNLQLGDITNLYDLRFKETITGINTTEYNSVIWTAMDYLFKDCSNLTSLNLSGWNTSRAVNMSNMFRGCSKLSSLNLSGWNTSNVEYMHNMFNGCGNLTSLDVSHFNTAKVTNMSGMFNRCEKLTSLDLSHFETRNVTDMSYLFGSCSSLTSLNLSGLNASNVTYSERMFYNCTSLETINSDGLKLPNINLNNIRLNTCPKLTVDSIVGLLNALPTTTHNYSFQIGTDNIAKLSEEQKAIATNKNWRLV